MYVRAYVHVYVVHVRMYVRTCVRAYEHSQQRAYSLLLLLHEKRRGRERTSTFFSRGVGVGSLLRVRTSTYVRYGTVPVLVPYPYLVGLSRGKVGPFLSGSVPTEKCMGNCRRAIRVPCTSSEFRQLPRNRRENTLGLHTIALFRPAGSAPC